jgi:hypothetical protein
MDPLTQGLLGASFGQALYGRALGRRALVWGALVRLDAAGRPAGAGERFDRSLPAPAAELVRRIWRETLGVS